ncbi:MAG: winged helix-turn-helix domain-containing protein [Candidatus Bathyarchaeia archaeon]
MTEDLSRHYTLLRDPARRKIIEILGTQEKIGFKELREMLGLGVGTVYYHLDMLSDFITQDKQRKYRLNDRGQALYRVLKEGSIPTTLDISVTFSSKIARWLFLSPLFAKTAKPFALIPSIAILLLGAFGAAQAKLEPALFFYTSPYSTYSQFSIIFMYIFGWVGLFLFVEILTSLIYRRFGNELQLFACINLAAFPLAAFPYIYIAVSTMLPTLGSIELNAIMQYVQIALQIWSLLLVTAAICFGKGIRLDKAFMTSLSAMYLNMLILFLLGAFK